MQKNVRSCELQKCWE